MKAYVHVTPRRGVLDPQGQAIQSALGSLGFSGVKEVRQGKVIEIELEDDDRATAESRLKAMCEQLLANPIMEDYRVELA